MAARLYLLRTRAVWDEKFLENGSCALISQNVSSSAITFAAAGMSGRLSCCSLEAKREGQASAVPRGRQTRDRWTPHDPHGPSLGGPRRSDTWPSSSVSKSHTAYPVSVELLLAPLGKASEGHNRLVGEWCNGFDTTNGVGHTCRRPHKRPRLAAASERRTACRLAHKSVWDLPLTVTRLTLTSS